MKKRRLAPFFLDINGYLSYYMYSDDEQATRLFKLKMMK
jgi:hypothetical protein